MPARGSVLSDGIATGRGKPCRVPAPDASRDGGSSVKSNLRADDRIEKHRKRGREAARPSSRYAARVHVNTDYSSRPAAKTAGISIPYDMLQKTSRGLKLVASYALLLAVACLLQAPLRSGRKSFRPSADGIFHYSVVRQLQQAHADGIMYPRWLPAQQGGLGDATLMYYPPLFHQLSAVFAGLVGSPLTGMQATMVLFSWLAGVFAFQWFHERMTHPRALIAAGALVSNPFTAHLELKPETYPWACSLPLIVLFLRYLFMLDRSRYITVRLALITAVQCLLHTLTAFMLVVVSPVAVALAVYGAKRRLRDVVPTVCQLVLSILLGVSLAAFYQYPAIATLRYINTKGWIFTDACATVRSFMLPLVTARSGMCWFSYQVLFPVFAGVLIVAAYWSSERLNTLPLVMFSLVSFLFGSELAWLLWTTDNPVRMLQFPWRFGSLTVIASLVVGLLHWGRQPTALRTMTLLLAACWTSALVAEPWIRPETPVGTPEQLIARGAGSPPEYLPAGSELDFRTYQAEGGWSAQCAAMGAACEVVEKSPLRQSYLIRSPRHLQMNLPLYCYPAWRWAEPAASTSPDCDRSTGLVRVDVPAGQTTYELKWFGLPEERWGAWISIGSAVVLAGICVQRRLGMVRRSVRDSIHSTNTIAQ